MESNVKDLEKMNVNLGDILDILRKEYKSYPKSTQASLALVKTIMKVYKKYNIEVNKELDNESRE